MTRYVSLAARSAPLVFTEGELPSRPGLFLVREGLPASDLRRERAGSPDADPLRDAFDDIDAPKNLRGEIATSPPTPATDPFNDIDALEDLGDEIATLAAHIHAATQRMLLLLADFDRRRGWEIGGHRSCAHWLAYRTGLDLGAARERVRTARVLVGLPLTRASMGRGELSFSQVRALSRVATPENEADLLDLARGITTAQLERVVRGWKRGSRKDEAAWERERHEARTFSVFPDDDGMYRVKGRLEPEVGALLMRAIEAASDALYRKAWDGAGSGGSHDGRGAEDPTLKAAAQRRADAIGLLAERAMAAGFGGGIGNGGRDVDEPDDVDESGDPIPISGTRAERYQVVLHVDEATLKEADDASEGASNGVPASGGDLLDGGDVSAETSSRSHLDDGTRVSAETSRRLACDAGLVRITHRRERPRGSGSRRAGDDSATHRDRPSRSSPLDVGRRTRTIPPALRRALDARDGGCRFPGCGLRFTDAHHLEHWADGGETSLANTLLLCRHHHRLVHEGGWQVMWWGEGRPVFIDPRGGTHFDGRGRGHEAAEARRTSPDPPAGTRRATRGAPSSHIPSATTGPTTSLDALVRENRSRGVDPDYRTAGARWKRLEDVPDDVLYRAMEALE